MKAEWIVWGFWLLAAFLSGSIMFCRFLPRWIAHKDVCVLSADHNPGAGNVFVCCGIPLGMLCLLLDMGKGFLPIYLACRQVNPQHILFALLMAAPVLGHALAVFYRGPGGKCISVSFGVLLALVPLTPACWVLAAVYILFSTVIRIGSHRKRSIVAFAVFAVVAAALLVYMGQIAMATGCVLIAAIAIVKHFVAPEETEAKEME